MTFERNGFVVVEDVISDAQRDGLIMALPAIERSGSRVLLSRPVFRDLVPVLRVHAQLADLPAYALAISIKQHKAGSASLTYIDRKRQCSDFMINRFLLSRGADNSRI